MKNYDPSAKAGQVDGKGECNGQRQHAGFTGQVFLLWKISPLHNFLHFFFKLNYKSFLKIVKL